MLFPILLLNSGGNIVCSVRSVLSRILGVLSGLALYLLLPLRAMSQPVVNWGDASTPAGFFWLVSGRLYSHYLWDLPRQDLLVRMRSVPGFLLEQYTWLGVLLALFGLFSLRNKSFRLATLWVVISTICFAVLYGSMDSQVYLLPVWVVFALWIAFGLQDVLEGLRNHPHVQGSLCVSLLIMLLLRIPATFRQVDVSHDWTAVDFISNSLENIPPDALVLIDGDQTTFSLWYAQIGEQRRMDIRFVASGLLPFDWYVHSLGRLYPDLKIPEQAYLSAADLISANPGRPLCVLTDEKPLRCDPY